MLGAIVVARGDRVRVDGCDLDLGDPSVSLAVKSRFVLDRYERPERAALLRYLDRDRPVLELGACLGVLACVTNRLLTAGVHHVVVEANPHLLPLIERQRVLNGATFVIEHAALDYGDEAIIYVNQARITASSAQRPHGEPVRVAATSLARLAERHGLDGFTLISDIEGAELELVEQEADVLAARVRTLILETHPDVYGEFGRRRLVAGLETAGFRLLSRDGEVHIFRHRVALAEE